MLLYIIKNNIGIDSLMNFKSIFFHEYVEVNFEFFFKYLDQV